MLREPSGGYFAACTAASASSRVFTIGTITPYEPASSARLIQSTPFWGTRMSGTVSVVLMACSSDCVSVASTAPCS